MDAADEDANSRKARLAAIRARASAKGVAPGAVASAGAAAAGAPPMMAGGGGPPQRPGPPAQGGFYTGMSTPSGRPEQVLESFSRVDQPRQPAPYGSGLPPQFAGAPGQPPNFGGVPQQFAGGRQGGGGGYQGRGGGPPPFPHGPPMGGPGLMPPAAFNGGRGGRGGMQGMPHPEKTAGGALAKRPTGADKNNAAAVPLGDGEISGDGGDQARRADLPGEVTRQRRRRRRGVQTAWQREEAPPNALALDTEDLEK
ncbi:hypothetical protein T484DRAFT_1896854 [Baffinella frigidus]|nr:hypothetical protein T484DRAFT_1896854 [Cryptophyta sp. CCMP2293]